MYSIGAQLAELRRNKGWTQRQLAKYLHKSASAVGSYEQDVQMPPADVLISLAELYHVSIDSLLGLADQEMFSAKGLNEQQRDAIELILHEFRNPTGNDKELSSAHLNILNALLRIFLSH